MLLSEYAPRPELEVPEHPVNRARFPVVDGHNHLGRIVREGPQAVQALLAEMDACNVQTIVDLDGGRALPLERSLEMLKKAYPERFRVLAVLPWEKVLSEERDWGNRLAEVLAQAVSSGADGLKIHKSLGLRLRDMDGELIMPDDGRLAPLFSRCAELGVPVLIHVADPVAFFRPLDRHNERWEELRAHPDWHFYGDAYPLFDALMEAQERMLERHPDTVFQSAHVASAAERLQYVSQLLDRYPNLNVDISARIAELGRQPYSAREFFLRYQDRIVYGTDVKPAASWQRIYMRFLETWDEHFAYGPGEVQGQGRWRIYGLGLPDAVLRKVYYANAARLYHISVAE